MNEVELLQIVAGLQQVQEDRLIRSPFAEFGGERWKVDLVPYFSGTSFPAHPRVRTEKMPLRSCRDSVGAGRCVVSGEADASAEYSKGHRRFHEMPCLRLRLFRGLIVLGCPLE